MYRYLSLVLYTSTALLAPTAAHAAVVISEIAWMGTSVSGNAEWIELQNTDSIAVALSGWSILSSTDSPSISLTGSIAGNGLYLLERTSDASVPTVAADQIYSGALPNTGITLTLKDATATVVDTVVGGTDWKSIGGDNVSKQTPQRSGSKWVTAEPTPRAENSTEAGGGEEGTIATTTDPLVPQPSVGGSAVVIATPVNPIPRLYINAGPGRILTAGAETYFTAHAYDSDGNIRNDARFSWSFGDGAGGDGAEVAHTFTLPGTYTVAIHASAGPSDVVSLLAVRALASSASIVASDDEGITIRNTGDALLDLSSWKLTKDSSSFVLPRYTTLLPGQESRFAASITNLATSTTSTRLLFPDSRDAATFETLIASSTPETTSPVETQKPVTSAEQALSPQLLVRRASIQEVEEVSPQLPSNISSIYDPQTRAPSALENTSVLGASAGSLKVSPFLTSPWTFSFMGLVVAAASILVIL